ncbi:MAG: hypothetical protein EON56_01715 [Alphaproteobacteria bacterium]|nr:MAG: hypothetical protein EON56_01715 [Alphaproteobacteria bacterium]
MRDRWIEMYRNREVHEGESVMRAVTAEDEWCAEAYMETDYSQLNRSHFEAAVRNYALFKLFGRPASSDAEEGDDAESQ